MLGRDDTFLYVIRLQLCWLWQIYRGDIFTHKLSLNNLSTTWNTAPSSLPPVRCAHLLSPSQIFFFNNKVIVDSVRKIQFLADVYVPEGLSLGIKLAADSVAHSWHWGQLPRKPALLQNNCTALSSWFSLLSWEVSRKTNAFCPLKSLSRVRLFAATWTVARQAHLSMGFSRQNTGVGCHFLLQGTFPTQGSNPGLLHCEQTLYHLSHQGSESFVLYPPFKHKGCCMEQCQKTSKGKMVDEPNSPWVKLPRSLPMCQEVTLHRSFLKWNSSLMITGTWKSSWARDLPWHPQMLTPSQAEWTS